VIELECTDKVIANGNETVNFVTKNYGHAGVRFIEYVMKHGANLKERFKAALNAILALGDTEEKQASSMALMILADELAGECIFGGEKRLEFSDISGFLVSVEEIDNSERAFDFVMSLVSQNTNKFSGSGNYSFAGETWGKIDGSGVIFNKHKLDEQLGREGFSFDACKKKWADKGYLIKYGKQYSRLESYNNVKSHCVKLNIKGGYTN
jgi:uncharacterized protein (DUF927 family)